MSLPLVGVKVEIEIVTTELDIARKRVTLSDIAKDLGLSVNAVSGVLNGRDNVRVGEATRKAILASARRLGYRRNVGASVLAGGKTRSIGLLVADIRNAFSAPVAGSFEEELHVLATNVFWVVRNTMGFVKRPTLSVSSATRLMA